MMKFIGTILNLIDILRNHLHYIYKKIQQMTYFRSLKEKYYYYLNFKA